MLRSITVTPEKTLRDTPAEFVSVTLEDGELGIAPGHAPMLGRLGSGEMRITTSGKTDRYYVEGGFVEVLDNVVSVLTPRAVPAGELDEKVAVEQLETALARPATSPELMAARDEAVRRSRALLHVVRRGNL
ncbi:MAG TPA: ATP synthase F1 subunit epsilon [Thermoguttaceae bacterium]|nr:ATP synthase F1 subunit epsilon [Thermoguttaceae bacterium]